MRVVVCSNDKDNINRIQELTTQMEMCEVKYFTTVFALSVYIYEEMHGDVDAVYIDENVNDEDGVEVARDLQNIFPFLKVVFMIAPESKAEKIFAARPTYMLRKPIQKSFMEDSYKRIQEEVDGERDKVITVTSKGVLTRIKTSSIQYIESQGRKLFIYTSDLLREVNMTMGQIKQLLPENFYQCHRSYIVNLYGVKQLLPGEIMIGNQRVIPVARSRYEEMKKKLTEK